MQKNYFSEHLKEQGIVVKTVDRVDWWQYNGFFMPAYLPHCIPDISKELALKVLKETRSPFIRWDQDFNKFDNSEWWYVLKKGTWDVADIQNKKKRWMINKGKKNFNTRVILYDEAVNLCPEVAFKATERYKGKIDVENRDTLIQRTIAGSKVPGVLEYIGCFEGGKLVSYSENYLQDNAVWLAVIRHDPGYLNDYSSYALMNGILNYYLNEQKFKYVLDGCRSIHHKTNFQEHLIKNFNFTKVYSKLNLAYSSFFNFLTKTAYPARSVLWPMSEKFNSNFMDNVSAVLKQEWIRRECLYLKAKEKHLRYNDE